MFWAWMLVAFLDLIVTAWALGRGSDSGAIIATGGGAFSLLAATITWRRGRK
jgi:hypothetical protein